VAISSGVGGMISADGVAARDGLLRFARNDGVGESWRDDAEALAGADDLARGEG
jgi:hypothetical protein